jgi:hypothetical protein
MAVAIAPYVTAAPKAAARLNRIRFGDCRAAYRFPRAPFIILGGY